MKKTYLAVTMAMLLLVGCGSQESNEVLQEKTVESVTVEETSTQSEEEMELQKEKYIGECQPFQYKEFFRYEEKYKGTKVSLVLEVAQVMEDGLRCYSYTGDAFSIGDEYVIFDDRIEKDMRILEDDIITVWGEYIGSVDMTRGINDVTEDVPAVSAKYIELMDENGTGYIPEESTGVNQEEELHEEVVKEDNIETTNPMIEDIFTSGLETYSWQSESTGYYLIPFLDSGEYQIWFTYENDTIWANTAYTMDVSEIENTPSGGIICRGEIYEAAKENPPCVGVAEVTWHSKESIDFCSVKLVDGHQFSDTSMVADDYSYYGKTGQDLGQGNGISGVETQGMYVSGCKEAVTLRKAPSTKAEKLAEIPLYSQVSYIGLAENGFAEIIYDGKQGYVLSQYLDEYEPQVATGIVYEVVNCNESITLWSSASTEADEICQIPLGDVVEYIESADNGFFLVSYGWRKGFVLSSYLSKL